GGLPLIGWAGGGADAGRVGAPPLTAVIRCRADANADAKTRRTDPQALRVGRNDCGSQCDGGRNSDSKCSHSKLPRFVILPRGVNANLFPSVPTSMLELAHHSY